MFKEEVISQVKAGVDFVGLLKSYGFEVKTKGKDSFIKCPFHKDDTASLSVTADKNLFHCFGCDKGGDVIDFVMEYEGLGFKEAFEKVVEFSNVKPGFSVPVSQSKHSRTALDQGREGEVSLQSILNDSFSSFTRVKDEDPRAFTYLCETRALSLKHLRQVENEFGYCGKYFGSKLDKKSKSTLKEIGLLNSPGKPFFKDCVVFALRNLDGKLTSLYGRKIDSGAFSKEGSHYFLKSGTEGRKGVFGIFKGHQSGELFICESVIDALSLLSAGAENILALHGVNGWTACHAEFVNHHKPTKITIFLDGDTAGKKASLRLKSLLESEEFGFSGRVNILDCPENEDANSLLLAGKLKSLVFKESLSNEPVPKPQTLGESGQLKEKDDGFEYESREVIYTLRGLSVYGLDKLRVTLRARLKSDPSKFVVDHVDFYKRLSLERFKEAVFSELNQEPIRTGNELKTLLGLLEDKRLELLENVEGSEDSKPYEMSTEEKEEALLSLKDKDLVANLLSDFEACGTVGEENGKLLGYLGTVSRFLDKPLGVLIVSRSGAGKTTLQESFLDFVPKEDLEKYSRISEKVLFYKGEEGLKHKVLALEEEEGMSEAAYSIRALQSAQELSSISTRTDPKTGKMTAEQYTVKGPVFIVISTTSPDALDYETRNRFVILTIDESGKQTEAIMKEVRNSYTLEGMGKKARREKVKQRCQNMQRLLKPIKVVNPYAPYLEFPFTSLQMRREFKKYMTLISSITLLHQHQREVKNDSDSTGKDSEIGDYIEVEISDIALANRLVLDFFPNVTDELAPHTRRLGIEISKLVEHKLGEVSFTRKELRDFCKWSDWQVREGLRQLEELEYISRISGRNGSRIVYEMLVDVRSEKREGLFLTDPKRLESLLMEQKSKPQLAIA